MIMPPVELDFSEENYKVKKKAASIAAFLLK